MYNFIISLGKTIGFRWHWFQMSTKKVTKFKQKCLCILETLSSRGGKALFCVTRDRHGIGPLTLTLDNPLGTDFFAP